MKKPLYNICIFIFHIITIVLLVALCLHFGIIRFAFVNVSKDAILSFFSNDYVINIFCTIITAVTLYIIQTQYSKHKLKNDFRCNEIIHDLYYGIDETVKLVKASKEVLGEQDKSKKDECTEYNVRRKSEAEKYLSFYKQHKAKFEICTLSLTYHNNWILIDSVQMVFFINLNFKLLNIVNNIKNRKPNLKDKYPEIEKIFEAYEKDNDDQILFKLGYEIRDFLVDLEFMAKYWLALLNYLGYDPMPIKLYIQLFKNEYPEYNDVTNFFQLPVSEQNKISRKIQRKAKKIYLAHRIKNFFK